MKYVSENWKRHVNRTYECFFKSIFTNCIKKKAWEVNMILLVFLFLPLFWCFQVRCSNGSSQHLILRLFRTYLALYLVQSDTKIHTHQVIFATVCRTFIVPLLASSLSVSSYDTDAFYHFQQNEKSYCLFDKIWMIPNRDDPDIHILSKYISKYY